MLPQRCLLLTLLIVAAGCSSTKNTKPEAVDEQGITVISESLSIHGAFGRTDGVIDPDTTLEAPQYFTVREDTSLSIEAMLYPQSVLGQLSKQLLAKGYEDCPQNQKPDLVFSIDADWYKTEEYTYYDPDQRKLVGTQFRSGRNASTHLTNQATGASVRMIQYAVKVQIDVAPSVAEAPFWSGQAFGYTEKQGFGRPSNTAQVVALILSKFPQCCQKTIGDP